MEKRLLNINEAAEYMGLSKNTLYAWVCQRRIPFVKCGRLTKFDIRDIDKWIDEKKVKEQFF
ncbi:MAG: helix-turn-helix domain-containing protein [Elusimicrobiota bacterium]